MPYHIGFIIEQVLGHVTHGQNLQMNVALDPEVRASWALPTWKNSGLASKIPVYRSNWTLQAGVQTRRALSQLNRRADLDILFFHTQVTAILAQDWMSRIPSIVSLDATPRQYDKLGKTYAHNTGPGWLEQGKWRLNRNCFRRARHLVTWSEWAKQGLIDEYQVPAKKVSVIPPGVNIDIWKYPSEWKQKDQVVRILFVGGDLHRKGGQVLLEAFRSLRQDTDGDTIELHLVTRTSLPHEPGVFIYNNMQPNSTELRHLFFTSHIFCLPTFGDCLPMVLSEAGAAGLPLVSTPVGAISEIVIDGETGFIVPVGDSEKLKFFLRRLVFNPELRFSLGDCAKRLVKRDYDAENNANKLLAILKQTAEETRHHLVRHDE